MDKGAWQFTRGEFASPEVIEQFRDLLSRADVAPEYYEEVARKKLYPYELFKNKELNDKVKELMERWRQVRYAVSDLSKCAR